MTKPIIQDELNQFQTTELASERHNNVWRTENYVLPLIDQLFTGVSNKKTVRILSVGCGNGEDVDTFIEYGYSAMGVDTGYRSEEWKRRKHSECFKLADAKILPFEDGVFDLVLSFGVIEHIGAVGDSLELLSNYQEHREQYAKEILRVAKNSGYVLITTPNKRFPLDMWHGPFVFGARLHSPFEKFLASYGEIKSLFYGNGDCSEVKVLGLNNFFQFKKSGKQLWIRMLMPVIRFALQVISNSNFLKKSFLNPFLIVLFRKKS